MPALVTARQLAEIVGLSPGHLMALAIKGTIPSVRINRRVVRFDAAEVLTALRSHSTAAVQ